jgi:hypothetical protein
MGKASRYDTGVDDSAKAKKQKAKRSAPILSKAAPGGASVVIKTKSASNRLRDAKRALAKLAKQEDKPPAEEEDGHSRALEQKVYGLERKKEKNAKEKADKLAKKKQTGKDRLAMVIEKKKVRRLLKKCKEEEAPKLQGYLLYIKRFPLLSDGKISYISLFDDSMDEEKKQRRADFLLRCQEEDSDQGGSSDEEEEEEAEGGQVSEGSLSSSDEED